MPWSVILHDAFEPELRLLAPAVQDELTAMMVLLREFGPVLGRPHVDTLNGSRHANMKEMRFSVEGGVWRTAFAFDPARSAIVLVAGNKAGVTQRRFYKRLVALADSRFDQHLGILAPVRR